MSATIASSCSSRTYLTANSELLLPLTPSAAGQIHPHGQFVPELVAAQAARTPCATALATGGDVITYGELEKRANQLAHCLMGLGVGRETIVALCLNRSPESIVCSLAVLKAGGAYLPLDPNY